MFAWVSNPEAWIALGTLIALEIVLGIDNIISIYDSFFKMGLIHSSEAKCKGIK